MDTAPGTFVREPETICDSTFFWMAHGTPSACLEDRELCTDGWQERTAARLQGDRTDPSMVEIFGPAVNSTQMVLNGGRGLR